ncbi:pyruvate, water dikinase regulatory protein [Clostridium sp. LBM24168]
MLKIYAVSDSIGETAEQVARATAYQFSETVQVRKVPYVKSYENVNDFINSLESREDILIISTIVLVDVREFLTHRCIECGIPINNILGPCISMAARILKTIPDYRPGAVWRMDTKYYKKIKAMEFAVQYDDSKNNVGIKYADVILIGLSRTSKTPICMYLANKGIKALNIPLMPEIPVPKELFEVNRRKIVALTIDPIQLIEIRKRRLDSYHRCFTNIKYADEERILQELDFSDKLIKRLNCKVIDVTKRAIEDTALMIMDYIGYTDGNSY